MKMNIKSEYFNEEFEVDIYEQVSNGRALQVVTHASLADLVHRVLPEKGHTLNYNYEYCTGLGYPAFICTMVDATGRRVSATGGALPASLTDDISRMFPVEMAEKRAFDRAVISFLGIPQKVYSSSEIEINFNVGASLDTPEEKTVKSEETKTQEPVVETVSPIVLDEEEEVIDAQAMAEEIDYSGYVLDLGKYRNTGKTLKEICEDNTDKLSGLDWLKFMGEKNHLKGEDKTAVEAYLRTLGM